MSRSHLVIDTKTFTNAPLSTLFFVPPVDTCPICGEEMSEAEAEDMGICRTCSEGH